MKEDKYFDIEKRTEIRETARKLRRQFLRYQEAELVYSMTHEQLVSILQYCNRREVKINRIYYERDNSNFKEWKKLCDSINGEQAWSEIIVSVYWKVFETHKEFKKK